MCQNNNSNDFVRFVDCTYRKPALSIARGFEIVPLRPLASTQ